MANETKPNEIKPPPAAAPANKTGRYDLVNPTRARRVINDGIAGSYQSYTIESGETKRNVELAEWVVKELRSRTKGRGKDKADLIVYAAGQAPDPNKVDDADEDEDTDDAA
jgi:hypothetical protein